MTNHFLTSYEPRGAVKTDLQIINIYLLSGREAVNLNLNKDNIYIHTTGDRLTNCQT